MLPGLLSTLRIGFSQVHQLPAAQTVLGEGRFLRCVPGLVRAMMCYVSLRDPSAKVRR